MAEHNEETDNFKISETARKKVDDIMNLDSNDESLKKWKEQLLGNALSEDIARKCITPLFRLVETHMSVLQPRTILEEWLFRK